MTSKSVRVDEEAYSIALQYGKNLSEAIRVMHSLIEEFRNQKFDADDLAKKISRYLYDDLSSHLEYLLSR
jgi:cell fate (sporulation/competence/biofilm development) regulator YmcA (YheA/YmcA/DUF963 family)